jgi:hypothetical protein
MAHHLTLLSTKSLAAALLTLAASIGAHAQPEVVWVDNESFAFANCSERNDLWDNADPTLLMRALRERGLADAGQVMRRLGLATSTVTLTPLSGARCDGGAPSVTFRLSSTDHASGRVWTQNLLSRMPVAATPSEPTPLRSLR